jgi:hypothetical protein
MQPSKLRSITLATLAGITLSACGDSAGVDGDAHIRVLLTDAAAEYIGTASVDIGAVELIPTEQGTPVLLTEDGTDGLTNLFELQNAATMVLAEATFAAGSYSQLRLIVEAAHVSLTDGYEFNDGSTEMDLIVPSGAETGIKLLLGVADADEQGPLIIATGEMELVLDFDVGQSFVIQGDPETPAGINSVLFTPTIRVAVPSAAGTITGNVSTSLESVSVEGLAVMADRADKGEVEEFQTETATTTTNADGTYALHFLVPGTYVVTVTTSEALTTAPESVEVDVGAAETVPDVDFEVVASG